MTNLLRTLTLLVLLPASTTFADTQLRWTLALPVRQTMWRHVRDMQKDTTYRPTAAGDLVFVGCEHNGALLALDAKTGQERWRYYTGGAIRTQPAADANQVIVGSDDGHVYCLGHDGKLRWKASVGRGQRFVIGHQRLTSAWPVPTHPLIADGKLYVMGGCWPADGVFMHAFDAASGKLLWKSPSMAMRLMLVPHWIKDGHVYARTYSGTGGRAARFNITTGVASAWPKDTVRPVATNVEVPGAADLAGGNESGGLLFGSGRDGKLYCAGPALDSKPQHHTLKKDVPAGDTDSSKAIVAVAGHQEGYALITGLTDGSLVEGLLRNSSLYVVAVDADQTKVDRIRADLDRRGCFDDHRLTVLTLDLKSDVLPPYFANVVVSESGAKPSALALESLRPYGGAAVYRNGGKWQADKRGKLAGAGNWSHEYANAAMTNATADTLVKAPLGVLWYGGPASDRKYYLSGNRPAGALIFDGRMFVQGNGIIAAVDSYTGRLLWEAETPKMHIYSAGHGGGAVSLARSQPWADEKAAAKGIPPIQRCRATGLDWAAAPDCVYLLAAKECLRFDPATGKPLPAWTMPLPADNGEELCWGCPRIVGDTLVATAFRPSDMRDAKIGSGGNGGDWTGDRMPMSHVFAVNRQSGKLLWSQPASFGFNNRAFIATADRVFCTDLLQSDAAENYIASGRKLSQAPSMLRAFDLKTGKAVWSEKLDKLIKYITYRKEGDMLLVPNRYGRRWTGNGWGWPGIPEAETRSKSRRPHGTFRAFRGKTGEKIWEISEMHYDGPFMAIGDLILNRYGTSFDPNTGKLALRESPLTGQQESFGFKKSGCAVLGGCESLVAWRTAYHDMTSGTSTKLPGFEAGCTTSLLPASGMLNLPSFGMFHLRSRVAALSMVHRPSAATWASYQLTKPKQETPLRRIGYNFGAPGDRYDENGTLWMQARRGGAIRIDVQSKDHTWFTKGDSTDWIGQSGVEGASSISVPTALNQKSSKSKGRYHVRLFFAVPKSDKLGDRVFDVSLEGKRVLTNLDIANANKPLLVHTFENVEITGKLDIELTASTGQTILCGVELVEVD